MNVVFVNSTHYNIQRSRRTHAFDDSAALFDYGSKIFKVSSSLHLLTFLPDPAEIILELGGERKRIHRNVRLVVLVDGAEAPVRGAYDN